MISLEFSILHPPLVDGKNALSFSGFFLLLSSPFSPKNFSSLLHYRSRKTNRGSNYQLLVLWYALRVPQLSSRMKISHFFFPNCRWCGLVVLICRTRTFIFLSLIFKIPYMGWSNGFLFLFLFLFFFEIEKGL